MPLRGQHLRRADRGRAAGGGLLVDDAACTPEWLASTLVPVLNDPAGLAGMAKAAASLGHRDADLVLAQLVLEAATGVSA